MTAGREVIHRGGHHLPDRGRGLGEDKETQDFPGLNKRFLCINKDNLLSAVYKLVLKTWLRKPVVR